MVTLDLVKADGVGVKIGATEDAVSRHKQQCLRFVHDLFGCLLVLLIGMRGNPVILLSGKEDYCTRTLELYWAGILGRESLLTFSTSSVGEPELEVGGVTLDLFIQLQPVTGATLPRRIRRQISHRHRLMIGGLANEKSVGFICDCVRVSEEENKKNMSPVYQGSYLGVVRAKAQLNPIS